MMYQSNLIPIITEINPVLTNKSLKKLKEAKDIKLSKVKFTGCLMVEIKGKRFEIIVSKKETTKFLNNIKKQFPKEIIELSPLFIANYL